MPTLAQPKYIIAIGASAGGLEEINSFFDHTPLDGVSYIIIQHLSPDFKSRMAELLVKHSKLTVQEAENGMVVAPNQVYLIPHDKLMTINNGSLFLENKEKTKLPNLTINRFFNSLATDYGKKAIGVILSGLGSDGTEGIKAIKKAGGMVIARTPETTEFGSMPSNAIATGLVDFILEPGLMPQAIEDYVKHEGELVAVDQDDEKNLAIIVDIIKKQLPLDFSEYKQTTILRRIKRRAGYNDIIKLEKYVDFLKANPEEVKTLAQDFLISVTAFFRDKEAFDYIEKRVLPDILKNLNPDEELKLWVAGCATGEEAYSLAILISGQLTGKFSNTIVKIFATDIDKLALVHAGKGVYTANVVKDLPAKLLEKYFLKDGENYTVKTAIRKMVIFAQHDLVKNPPYCNMQMISCRNLLIYMTPVLQDKVFSMLLFGLKKHGYLFLGSSENPTSILQNLEVLNKKWRIYKNLTLKQNANFNAFSMPQLFHTKPESPLPLKESTSTYTNQTLAEAVNASLAEAFNCLTICVDENKQVVKYYGDTTRFLLQKNFTSNLEDLLPNQLAVAFSGLPKKVLKTNKKAIVNGIKIKYDGSTIKVNLLVSPLEIKKGEQKLLLVTITEDQSGTSAIEENIVFDEKTYRDQYTLNLEDELKELKETLNSVYEKLDTSNENMQSFNEELLSSNEEMQSTNEEMQSVNEELHTVNIDYQLKNKELAELNDDLNNYFRSNINGQLFVNKDLLLMKFSPGTVKQINLLPTDVGRPLSNITTNIIFETIIDDIKSVISDGNVVTKEIETADGKWYQVMTMPYIQADNTRNGAMITFNDITELKQAQQDLDKKNQSLLRINADLDHFVLAASHDLLAPLSNIEGSITVMNLIKVNNPELSKFLNIINTSVKKFRILIKELATVGKLESDTAVMEMVDIDELIDEIEWSLENQIKSVNAVIKRNLKVKQILFSKKNLRSILFNLISNGIKFKRDEQPKINVCCAAEGNLIILSVEDNGIGIAQNKLERIFELYGRLNQDMEGQGIGLFLAKKIIDRAGGNFIVESELGKGSKFLIHFQS